MARWTNEEWNKVCLELYRRNPVITMTSKTLLEVGQEQMYVAMRAALPEDRWHISMNVSKVRPKLLEVRDRLKAELQRVEQEQSSRQQEVQEQERQHAKARSRVDVFAPMIEVIAEKLFEHLKPMMESYIDARLAGTHEREATVIAKDVHKPQAKKLRVGVVGLLPIQEQEVASRFPFLDMTFYDKDKSMRGIKAWASNLDAVFGLVAKMSHNHGMEGWEHFHQVPGRGTSSVIHSIEIWLISNGHKKAPQLQAVA